MYSSSSASDHRSGLSGRARSPRSSRSREHAPDRAASCPASGRCGTAAISGTRYGRNGCGQFDVAHTFTADFLQRHFNAAFLADNAAILHALIFAAQTFVILDRAKDTRAEQTVTLGLERAVVDGFGLFDLAIRPAEDTLGRGQRDLDLVKYLCGAAG